MLKGECIGVKVKYPNSFCFLHDGLMSFQRSVLPVFLILLSIIVRSSYAQILCIIVLIIVQIIVVSYILAGPFFCLYPSKSSSLFKIGTSGAILLMERVQPALKQYFLYSHFFHLNKLMCNTLLQMQLFSGTALVACLRELQLLLQKEVRTAKFV